MASDARITAAAINAAISSANYRSVAAPEERRWKGYWAKYWCFKSQKRERRVVPATRVDGATESVGGGPPAQPGRGVVPPSSPASFVNSSIQSPARSLAAASANCSPGPINTMFTIGPYAHETQLVSPPVFSTFTTEPSTAPFTPPPELAHLTTPLSPDVPFAQYIASSLEAKAVRRGTISPLSTSTLASPCDTPASYTPTSSLVYVGTRVRENMSPLSTSNLASPCDTPPSYTPTAGHIYLGSPVGHLVLPSFGNVAKDTMMGEGLTSSSHKVPLFPTFDPFASRFNHVPALILPCDSKFEDPQMPVASESDLKDKEEGSRRFNKASNLIFTPELKLDSTHLQKEATGSMILEQHTSSSHGSNEGTAYQSDATFLTSSMDDVIGENSSNYEKNGTCISSTVKDDKAWHAEAISEHIKHFEAANASEEVEAAGRNGLTCQLNVTFLTSNMKEYAHCINEGERLQNRSLCRSEKDKDCISYTTRNNEYWEGSASHLKTADTSGQVNEVGSDGVAYHNDSTIPSSTMEERVNYCSNEGERSHRDSSCQSEENGNHSSSTISDYEGWQCEKSENYRSSTVGCHEDWQESDE